MGNDEPLGFGGSRCHGNRHGNRSVFPRPQYRRDQVTLLVHQSIHDHLRPEPSARAVGPWGPWTLSPGITTQKHEEFINPDVLAYIENHR